ncbi:hypothetical protein KCU77_g52, partial [Aureobasidium melanogenum]
MEGVVVLSLTATFQPQFRTVRRFADRGMCLQSDRAVLRRQAEDKADGFASRREALRMQEVVLSISCRMKMLGLRSCHHQTVCEKQLIAMLARALQMKQQADLSLSFRGERDLFQADHDQCTEDLAMTIVDEGVKSLIRLPGLIVRKTGDKSVHRWLLCLLLKNTVLIND